MIDQHFSSVFLTILQIFSPKIIFDTILNDPVVVVNLPDPFRGMGSWRNSTETQQSGHVPKSGPEVKNGRSSAEDGAPERSRHKECSMKFQSIA